MFVWQDYTVHKNIQQRSEKMTASCSSVHGNIPNISTLAIYDHNSMTNNKMSFSLKKKQLTSYSLHLTDIFKARTTVIKSQGAKKTDMWIHFVWLQLLKLSFVAKSVPHSSVPLRLACKQFFVCSSNCNLTTENQWFEAFKWLDIWNLTWSSNAGCGVCVPPSPL